MSNNVNFATKLRAAFQIITTPRSSNIKSGDCVICGRKFSWVSDGVGRNKKYCSEDCRKRARLETAKKYMNKRYEENEEYRDQVRKRSLERYRTQAEAKKKMCTESRAQKRIEMLTCRICGQSFKCDVSGKTGRRPGFCSEECRAEYQKRKRSNYYRERYHSDEEFRKRRIEQTIALARSKKEREGEEDGE